MMRVTKCVMAAAICCALVTGGNLYARQSPEMRAEGLTKRMQKQLQLTAEQKGRVYQINLFYARQADDAATLDRRAEQKSERKAIRHHKNADLRAALTGEQYGKYREMQAANRARMHERKKMQQENTQY